jgi:MinD-like ATPase involved in chromosome partitioning or flagellar assembly
MPKVVAIHSYRGGTGKSNLTANLAASVAMQGQRVAMIDTDLQSPGIHVLFGLTGETMGKTLNDYLWGRSPIEDAAYDVSHQLNNRGKLFLVPASVDTNEIAHILSEGYDVSLLNDGCRQLVRGLNLDYLFIDTHPGLSKETFLSIAMSNILLLILRPDSQDFQGTAVTIDVAKQLNVRKMMLVMNKVLTRTNFITLREQVEETYDVPVAGMFPLSEDVVQLGSRGVFCLKSPEHPFTREINRVTKQILG